MEHLVKLLRDSYDLQEEKSEKSAYWHLQKLRSEIKQLTLCGVVKELPGKESVVSELLKDLFKIIEDTDEKIKQLDRFKEYREAVANMQKDELKR